MRHPSLRGLSPIPQAACLDLARRRYEPLCNLAESAADADVSSLPIKNLRDGLDLIAHVDR